MTIRKRLSLLGASAIVVLVLALGVSAVFAQTDGGDDAPDAEGETPAPAQLWGHRGFPGFRGIPGQSGLPEGLTPKDELLADALNTDVETLEAARETARVNAIEQALAQGLITEAQAQLLLENAFSFRFHRGHGLHDFGGEIDREALLADALNISVEALREARQEANEAALTELVDAGYLTEEQVSLMAARQALKEAIDHNELLAEVLGVSPAEVEEARGNRESMAALIEDSGLSFAELAEGMRAAYEAAVDEAVENGVITAEEAEALQEAGAARGLFGGHGCDRRGFGGRQGLRGRGMPGGNGAFQGSGQQFGAPAQTGASI
ncbi:MAG: hypothetical protein JSW55_10865 [Chloroflexota bacterium]|nr:MAG: hypothetical protein JSW55_10865 [Chloroflexota bacterium]